MRVKRPAASTLLNVCMCVWVCIYVCGCVCVFVCVCVCVIGEHLSQYYLQFIPKHTIPMLRGRACKRGEDGFCKVLVTCTPWRSLQRHQICRVRGLPRRTARPLHSAPLSPSRSTPLGPLSPFNFIAIQTHELSFRNRGFRVERI